MTEPNESGLTPPAMPYLAEPQEQAVVDGSNVTFVWEPVEGAAAYRIEVASDTTFETLILERDLGEATSLTATDVFPADGATYYWRVFARNEAGESHGEAIESFISGTPEEAAQHFVQPDQAEEFGPVGVLVTEGHREVMHGDFQGPEALDNLVGVQYEGIGAGPILGFIFICVIFICGVVWVGINWAEAETQKARDAASADLNYPELRQVKLDAARLLNHYDVIDAAQGRYRIPIDRAIELMVREAYLAPDGNYSQELQFLQGN